MACFCRHVQELGLLEGVMKAGGKVREVTMPLKAGQPYGKSHLADLEVLAH